MEAIKRKRPMTAKAMAEKFNVSTRTVQRIFSEPRAVYEANSITKAEPWKAFGVSRSTWYSRRSEFETKSKA